jgi:hypothetical protein
MEMLSKEKLMVAVRLALVNLTIARHRDSIPTLSILRWYRNSLAPVA